MNGTQTGLESVFTPLFGLVWVIGLVFGTAFALACRQARRMDFLPRKPLSTVEFVIVGTAVTGFLAGFIIGWETAVKLGLVFLATGIPQIVEHVWANLEAEKRVIRSSVNRSNQENDAF